MLVLVCTCGTTKQAAAQAAGSIPGIQPHCVPLLPPASHAACLPTTACLQHESITLNEEKKALATIKKLQQQRERVGAAGAQQVVGREGTHGSTSTLGGGRKPGLAVQLIHMFRSLCPASAPQVREYEASASLFAETRAKRTELQEAMKEYDGEIKALRQEMDVQVRRDAPGGVLGRRGAASCSCRRGQLEVLVPCNRVLTLLPGLCCSCIPCLAAPDPGQAAGA